ncbi:MAG: ABC transporter permease [Cyclobacteriaceae bacterium]
MRQPPVWLVKLFTVCSPDGRDDLLGDFIEHFQDDLEYRSYRATVWSWTLYSMSMLKLKIISNHNKVNNSNTTIIMIYTYFKIGRRQLVKNKLYSSINVLGLAVGLSAFVLISLFVYDEVQYDKHFPESDQIYRLAGSYDQGGDGIVESAFTSYLILPAAELVTSEEVTYTRLDFRSGVVKIVDELFIENEILAADSTFFDVFGFDFVSGSPEKVLRDPKGIAIDLTTSKKYFDQTDPMGQLIEIDEKTFQVVGVFNDLPSTTHFQARIILPIHGIMDWYAPWVTTNLTGTSHATYFKAAKHVDIERLATNIEKAVGEKWIGEVKPKFFAQPITDIHLNSDLANEVGINGSQTTVTTFTITALIVLLLACINYVNLSVAVALDRGKEVGIKKVLGAGRRSQTLQFQAEAFLMGMLAVVLSLIMILVATPFFNQITDKSILLGLQDYLLIGTVLIAIVFVLAIAVGTFPALFLLKDSIKDNLSGSRNFRGSSKFTLRDLMVSLQFFLAAILIGSTLVITQQVRFMRNKDLGVDSEHVVLIPFGASEIFEKYEVIKSELQNMPGVVAVTASSVKPTNRIGGWRGYKTDGMEEDMSCPTVVVDHNYFETMGVRINEGRTFSKTYTSDYTESYIINEAAAKFFGFENTVGEKLAGYAFTGAQWSEKNARIVGVVEDFHFASLHNKIRPTVFSLSSEITIPLNWMIVRISGQQIPETLASLDELWRGFTSDRPFYFEFMDDELAEHYQAEDQLLKVLSAFSLLSIFLGCLGLFGLTAFMMRRRTKEIGIRKVLGASNKGLIGILSKDFLRLVLLANIIGAPVAFWLMKNWLADFAYQIPLSAWPFILTAVAGLLIAFVSISYHSLKAAQTNPVDSIMYE